MRIVRLTLGTFILLFLIVTIADAQQCRCYWLTARQYTCRDASSGCNRTITYNVCSGIRNNCQNCTSAFTWIPCCGIDVGSSATTGPCAYHGEKPAGVIAQRVYYPNCSGVFVPAFAR